MVKIFINKLFHHMTEKMTPQKVSCRNEKQRFPLFHTPYDGD